MQHVLYKQDVLYKIAIENNCLPCPCPLVVCEDTDNREKSRFFYAVNFAVYSVSYEIILYNLIILFNCFYFFRSKKACPKPFARYRSV